MSFLLKRRRPSCPGANRFAPPIAAPDVFGRPMDPAPAPLVYINGWPGVGKEAVSECLTLMLGKDKAVLIDVRSVGLDGDNGIDVAHNPLLTPEHPKYFSFDVDVDSAPMASSDLPDSYTDKNRTPPLNSGVNLSRLLLQPSYNSRIAVLATCAPDTPAGRATVQTLEAAATRSGRLFIPIALECAPAEHVRRAGSLQRQCSYKARRTSVTLALSGHGNETFHQKLAMPVHQGLTVDITSTPACEAALQIVEFVKGCVVERDAELCSSSSSQNNTKRERNWRISD